MNRVPIVLVGLASVSAFNGGNVPTTPPKAPVYPEVHPAVYNNYKSTTLARCAGEAVSAGNKCFTDVDGNVFRYGCIPDSSIIVTDRCGVGGGCEASDCEGNWKDHGDLDYTCYDDGSNLYSFSCEKEEDDWKPEPVLAVPEAKSCAELGWRLQPGDLSVCGGSKVLYGACASGDFDAAAEICTAAGARLCTAAELGNNEAADTGCKGDCQKVWSADECVMGDGASGHIGRAGSAKCGQNFPDTCTADATNMIVRCCADAGETAAEAAASYPAGYSQAVAMDYKLADGNCGASKPVSQYSCWTTPSGETMRFACSDNSDDDFIYHQFCGSDASCESSSCGGDWTKSEETTQKCYSAQAEGYLYHYACPNVFRT